MLLRNIIKHVKPASDSPKSVIMDTDQHVPAILLSKAFFREEQDKRSGKFSVHVSSLINGFCARQQMLMSKKPAPVRQYSDADTILHTIGKALEERAVDSYIDMYGKSQSYGLWRCVCGYLQYQGFGNRTETCSTCSKPVTTIYSEPVLNYEHIITGAPDYCFFLNGQMVIYEFKSINGTDFQKINKSVAKVEHKFQVAFYHRLFQLTTGYTMAPDCYVIYLNKQYSFVTSRKESKVIKSVKVTPNEDDTLRKGITTLIDAAEKAHKLYQAGIVPERTVCTDEKSTPAQNCNCKMECFYG